MDVSSRIRFHTYAAVWCLLVLVCSSIGLALAASRSSRYAAACVVAALVLGGYVAMRRSLSAQASVLAVYVEDLPTLWSVPPDVDGVFQPVWAAAQNTSRSVLKQLEALGESRQQLEVLLEGMQDAVVSLDAGGRVQWSNAHMQRLIFRDAAGASIRQGRALVHSFRDPELLASVQRTLDEGEPTECRSAAVLPGHVFQVSAAPLAGGGAVVVFHDTTRAEQMERSQRDFVANVSHELRTPLTSIIGYVETVLDHEVLSAPTVEFLETALKNASRMQRLTEDLLLLSQVEQRENPLFLQPVSAATLVEDALRTVSGSTYAEDAEFRVAASVESLVLADANAIQQVLCNLLENAVKYSRGKGTAAPRVVLATEVCTLGAACVEFRIQDFGLGIAAEHLPRIFERFYRVEKARSRAVGGTGLGLSIARKLVEQHGGRLWVESVLGQGSTFFFTLPLMD